jgi:hypothetical protein
MLVNAYKEDKIKEYIKKRSCTQGLQGRRGLWAMGRRNIKRKTIRS